MIVLLVGKKLYFGVLLTVLFAATALAGATEPSREVSDDIKAGVRCVEEGGGFLRARLSGSISLDLSWSNEGTSCGASMRPQDDGMRLQFTRAKVIGQDSLVFVFGIPGVGRGQSVHAVPVNVTVIRQGAGEFFGTQGDDKCTIDELRQEPMFTIPQKTHAYRVIARGFCTQPARAIGGKGAVLVTRFDFATRIDATNSDGPKALAHPLSVKSGVR